MARGNAGVPACERDQFSGGYPGKRFPDRGHGRDRASPELWADLCLYSRKRVLRMPEGSWHCLHHSRVFPVISSPGLRTPLPLPGLYFPWSPPWSCNLPTKKHRLSGQSRCSRVFSSLCRLQEASCVLVNCCQWPSGAVSLVYLPGSRFWVGSARIKPKLNRCGNCTP